MRDRQTGTVWAHLDGYASQGPLAGERLRFVPMSQMKWGDWLALHPKTLVLDPDTEFADQYRPVRIGQPNPGEALYGDDRLAANALIVGVEANGEFVGFPIDLVGSSGGVVNTEVGRVPVVVIYNPDSRTGIAYTRTVGGQTVTFAADRTEGMLLLRDAQTGTTWRLDGSAVGGSLADHALVFVPSFISEWYGWSAYHPDTGLYQADPA
jgi:hypothetical protein